MDNMKPATTPMEFEFGLDMYSDEQIIDHHSEYRQIVGSSQYLPSSNKKHDS